MLKEKLENKLKEISAVLEKSVEGEESIGVFSGLAGMALFQFYYSKYLDVEHHADSGVDIISQCVQKINDGYNSPVYCDSIAGFGWTVDHLEQEAFIDIDNDELLSELDEYLYESMISDLKTNKFDFLYGAIGYAIYFLNRFRNTKSIQLKDSYKAILLEFITLLEDVSEKDSDATVKWLTQINFETKEVGYNIGLAHGMSSIIGILTKLYQHQEFKTASKPLLVKSINYVLQFKNDPLTEIALYPNSITKSGKRSRRSRLAWCYGDLGIGISLWHAAKALEDKRLEEEAMSVLVHATKRKSQEETNVIDAGICHGSYGIAHIFNRMYKETKNSVFKDASLFWIKDGLDRATFRDGFAGYKQWQGEENGWRNHASLLGGVAGIGLVILDFLADYETKWDECLMIS